MTKCIVYGLFSSRDGVLRYIGQTTQSLSSRLRQHRSYASRKQTAVHKWFLREIGDGFNVSIRSLCDEATLHETEKAFIAEHRAAGTKLLNHTDGGEGTVGWRGNVGKKRPDLAERNKRNVGNAGHPMSESNKSKLASANVGRKRPDTSRRSIGNKYFLGRKHSADTRAKQSAALIGRVFSAEAIEKMRAARMAYWRRSRA